MTDATRVYAPVPGPVDRVSFLDEQTRNRRESWKFALLSFFGVVIVGLPICAIITPLFLAFALLAAHVVQLFTPLPPDFWLKLNSAALALPIVFSIVTDQVAQMPASVQAIIAEIAPLITNASGDISLRAWLALAGLLVLPGSVFLLFAWVWLRSLLRSTGTAVVLHKLGAREPNRNDFEEYQLANIVEEIAVACVVQPPRLMMIDSPAANAAAFGLALDDATVVVTTGMLTQLDRDETQAIVAHVVASVGNGDLKIGREIVSLFQAWGLTVLMMGAPFGRYSRWVLGRVFRVALFGRRSPERWQEAAAVSELLFRGTEIEGGEDDMDRLLDDDKNPFRMVKSIVMLLAFGAAWLGSKIWVQVNALMTLGATLTQMWRARRLLADASAIQLTRYPDALARALARLAHLDVEVQGAADVSYLFAVWSVPTAADVKKAAQGLVPARRSGSIMTMQPTRWRRLERLQAQGAFIDPTPFKNKSLFDGKAAMIFLAPIGLVFLGIFLGSALLMMAVSLVVTMGGVVGVWMGLGAVFGVLVGSVGTPSP